MLSLRFLVAICLTASWLAAQSPSRHTEPQITIRLYNYSPAEPALLAQARLQATDIFERAGIRVGWLECPIPAEGAPQNSDCARPADVATIRLRVLSEAMSKKMAQKSIEFGYAVALKNGLGVFAGVYYDRAIREADSVGLARHVMLGHTIAHEVGHLLLGPSSHVGSGIMSPHWGQREVYLAGMGSFLFTETQARTMRRQAAKRVQRAEDQWAQLHKNAPRADGASEIAASR